MAKFASIGAVDTHREQSVHNHLWPIDSLGAEMADNMITYYYIPAKSVIQVEHKCRGELSETFSVISIRREHSVIK